MQQICKLFLGTSACIEGTPQIVDLDEEFVEDPIPYHYGNALAKGTECINRSKQYQSTITFQLTAVKKKSLKVKKSNNFVFGYIDGSDLDNEEMNDDDEKE